MSRSACAVVDNDDAIITLSFFDRYDALGDDASKLSQAKLACQKAELALTDLKTKLQSAQDEIRSNRSIFEEQTKRIQLFSTHWFYGSTAFQPKLWLNGGCAGKIARAKAKLEKCENEYPDLLSKEAQLQELLPEATRVVHEADRVYSPCRNAETTRQQMFDLVIQQYPSPKLFAVQEQRQTMSSRLDRVSGYCQKVKEAKTFCTSALSTLNRVERCIHQGKRSQEEFHRCEREWQSLPVRPGGGVNSIKTTQEQDEKGNEARKRLQRNMERAQTNAATQWRNAELAFGQASAEFRQARTTLEILQTQWIQSLSECDNVSVFIPKSFIETLLDDFVSIPKSFIDTLLDEMSSSPLGLFSSSLLLHSAELSFSPTRRSTTSSSSVQALERVRQVENYCNRLYQRIAELEKMLSDEKSLVERLEKQTVEDMTIEKKQIFEKVRLQVTKPFLDRDRCLAPSAPPEPGQDNENEGALSAPPISQRTGSEFAPPIQVPTTKDSHYMHRLQSLSDRVKQERQSIQALQRTLERARQQLPDLTTTKNEYNNTTVEANQDPTALITLWTQYFVDEQSLNDDASTITSMATTTKNNKVALKLTLGGLSHNLDQLAAQIDAVPSSSAGAAIIKQLKKELSTQIVTLMEQTDALISFYQQKPTVTTATTNTTTATTESQIENQVPTTKDSYYMHRLQSLSDRVKQERQSIQALQRALGRARQQSPDLTTTKNEYNNTTVEANQDPTALITLWTQYFVAEQSLDDDASTSTSMATTTKNNKVALKLTLGGLSHNLDQLAAQIDAVPSSSTGAAIVKQLKKELSTQIVTLMEQADALISFYQQKATVTTEQRVRNTAPPTAATTRTQVTTPYQPTAPYQEPSSGHNTPVEAWSTPIGQPTSARARVLRTGSTVTDFQVGDRVLIVNGVKGTPDRPATQGDITGAIYKLTPQRVHIITDSGGVTTRAPFNVALLQDE